MTSPLLESRRELRKCAFQALMSLEFGTDMETASLGEVCYVNKINFAGIRGISDSADEGANTDFRENLRKASDNCAILLCDIIKAM